MHKFVRFWAILAVFCVCGDVIAATARGGLGAVSNTNVTGATEQNTAVATRAANRTRVRTAPSASANASASSARVATRTSVRAATSAPVKSMTTSNAGTGVVARAGAKQKAVAMGTTVKGATENSLVSQECQTFFNGCMDSICMLDNRSGGRCRCDDRVKELDKTLDLIFQLQSQITTINDQGIERVQYGDAKKTIFSAADKVEAEALAYQIADQKDIANSFKDVGKDTNQTKYKLDLTSFTDSLFDTNDIFSSQSNSDKMIVDREGADLRDEALRLCGAKMPKNCSEDISLLQSAYAAQIVNDCTSYENNLKQQKLQVEDLLRQAKKNVRETVAEEYNKTHKYNEGECTLEFAKCMRRDDVCGEDFSKCIIDPSVVTNKSNKTKMYPIVTGAATIEIQLSTYTSMDGRKSICESVLQQCVDYRDNVWDAFLRNNAPDIKTAEFLKEDASRRSCVDNVFNCVTERASKDGIMEGDERWAMYVSKNGDKLLLEGECKIQLDMCASYDESMRKYLKDYVKNVLVARSADECNAGIRSCLLEFCGEDKAKCVNKSFDDVMEFCNRKKLEMYCGQVETNNGRTFRVWRLGADDLKEKIATVAKGLKWDFEMQVEEACKKAADKVMEEICGSTSSCDNLDFSDILNHYLGYRLYSKDADDKDITKPSIEALSTADLICPVWTAKITYNCLRYNKISYNLYNMVAGSMSSSAGKTSNAGRAATVPTANLVQATMQIAKPNLNVASLTALRLSQSYTDAPFISESYQEDGGCSTEGNSFAVNRLNAIYKDIILRMKNDLTVKRCIQNSKAGSGDPVDLMRNTIANSIYSAFSSQYNNYLVQLNEYVAGINTQISEMYNKAEKDCAKNSEYDEDCKYIVIYGEGTLDQVKSMVNGRVEIVSVVGKGFWKGEKNLLAVKAERNTKTGVCECPSGRFDDVRSGKYFEFFTQPDSEIYDNIGQMNEDKTNKENGIWMWADRRCTIKQEDSNN